LEKQPHNIQTVLYLRTFHTRGNFIHEEEKFNEALQLVNSLIKNLKDSKCSCEFQGGLNSTSFNFISWILCIT